MEGTIVQKTAHTLVAFVASMVLAATALADSYPVVSGYRFVSGGPFATTKPAVCSAFAALVSGDVHYDADGGTFSNIAAAPRTRCSALALS